MTKNIIAQYENDDSDTLVATEDDLKAIHTNAFVPTPEQVAAIPVQPVSNGEYKAQAPIKLDEKAPVTAPQTEQDLNTDYQYIRTNLYTITERSVEALNNLVQIADQSQHPRAYEVVALMVNAIASAQKDLMNIHKEKAKIEHTKSKTSPEVVNNNLFVGNTAQLDEIIKQMTKKQTNNE
jgi:hypothetical protein